MKTFYMYDNVLLNSSYNEKCFREKLQRKSEYTFYVLSIFSDSRAVYEIMLKNIAQPEMSQMTTWQSVALRARKHTPAPAHARTEICNTYCFSKQKWFRERASILRYVYTACLVI